MHTKLLFLVCLICSTSFTIVPVTKKCTFLSFLLTRSSPWNSCLCHSNCLLSFRRLSYWLQINSAKFQFLATALDLQACYCLRAMQIKWDKIVPEVLPPWTAMITCFLYDMWQSDGVRRRPQRQERITRRIPSWRTSSSQTVSLLPRHSSLSESA